MKLTSLTDRYCNNLPHTTQHGGDTNAAAAAPRQRAPPAVLFRRGQVIATRHRRSYIGEAFKMCPTQPLNNTYAIMLKHCLIVAAALLLVTYTVSAVPLPSEVAEGGAASRVELPAGAADTDIEGDDDLEIDGGDDENLDGGAACKSGASPRIRLTLGYRFARSWRKRIFHRFFRFFQWKVVRTILRRWVRAPLLSLISFAAPD